jgi:scyllo-inositol 2-dehydrogenase (NADP+)
MIKCVLIGAGRIALSHLPHILKRADIELVAIVEPSRIARFIVTMLSGVRVVSSIDKVDKATFDTVFILTPPQTHFAIAYPLIDKGKHIFLEKPLTLCPDQSEQLVNLAKKRRVQFSVGYVYRFHPVYMKLQKLLRSGDYGEIRSSEITMLGNVISDETPKTWRNVGLGSGCIFDYGCHAIDLSLFLFGCPDQTLCIDKQELFQKGVVDKFQARLKYTSDHDFDLDIFCNWADSGVRKAGITIEIKTKENSLWSDGQLIKIRGKITADYSIKDLNTDVPYYLRGEEFQNQLDHFATSIVTKQINYEGAEDAALCDDIISRLHES